MNYSNVKLFFIEGNIGSGKSTLLSWLELNIPSTNEITYHFIPEPINVWTTKYTEDDSFLSYYYKNRESSFLSFQYLVLIHYSKIFNTIKEIIAAEKNIKHIFILERSPFSMLEVFFKGLKNENPTYITYYDEVIYTKMFLHMFEWIYDISISIIKTECPLYLCFKRIEERQRKGENTININYLNIIEEQTNKYIKKMNTNFITINTETKQEYENIKSYICKEF